MDLIIRISDEVYKTVQDGSYCGSLYEELKAAIPYNPSGDLLNRIEELQNANAKLELRLNALISCLYPTCISKDDVDFIDSQEIAKSEDK